MKHDETFFKNIYKVSRGTFIQIKTKVNSSVFQVFKKYSQFYSENEIKEKFFDIFNESITRLIPNKNAFGTPLSGGLDSSSVTRALVYNNERLNLNKKIYSLSYSFSGLKILTLKKLMKCGLQEMLLILVVLHR